MSEKETVIDGLPTLAKGPSQLRQDNQTEKIGRKSRYLVEMFIEESLLTISSIVLEERSLLHGAQRNQSNLRDRENHGQVNIPHFLYNTVDKHLSLYPQF